MRAANAKSVDPAPVPRRTTRPKWLDLRIIGGLVLVIASIVVGAKVVGSSSHTSPVWAASRNLAVGTVLTPADLVAVDVNLADNAGHYFAAGAGTGAVTGRMLQSQIQLGELVPISAVLASPSGRVVVIAVGSDEMPPGVGHGSRIDLYLTSGGSSSGDVKTTLVASSITVQAVTAPASGGLSGASSSDYQLSVLLSPAVADNLVRTLPTGKAIVVLVTGR